MRWFRRRPKLSVVVVFFNMEREAERTLLSLTTAFQREISEADYEVLAIDSNSSAPLDPGRVRSLQPNFHYHYVDSPWPTPCRAMNAGIEMARADTVVCAIDGARIFSPGILKRMLAARTLADQPFIYTVAMHLGSKPQFISVSDGYNQQVEDQLLETVDWRKDGYSLFDISCLAGSSGRGFLHPIAESNCFAVDKALLRKLGGYDERFTTAGGGMVNLDTFYRLMQHAPLQPILLLGEASFHQFHGGVATNSPNNGVVSEEHRAEYHKLRGRDYQLPERTPLLFGTTPKNTLRFLDCADQ